MRSIHDIPLLTREEVHDLALEMRRHQEQFQRSLFAIPGTAVLVLERWSKQRNAPQPVRRQPQLQPPLAPRQQ